MEKLLLISFVVLLATGIVLGQSCYSNADCEDVMCGDGNTPGCISDRCQCRHPVHNTVSDQRCYDDYDQTFHLCSHGCCGSSNGNNRRCCDAPEEPTQSHTMWYVGGGIGGGGSLISLAILYWCCCRCKK